MTTCLQASMQGWLMLKQGLTTRKFYAVLAIKKASLVFYYFKSDLASSPAGFINFEVQSPLSHP
jgi:hypothetical protein